MLSKHLDWAVKKALFELSSTGEMESSPTVKSIDAGAISMSSLEASEADLLLLKSLTISGVCTLLMLRAGVASTCSASSE